jgi:hypothetical protein
MVVILWDFLSFRRIRSNRNFIARGETQKTIQVRIKSSLTKMKSTPPNIVSNDPLTMENSIILFVTKTYDIEESSFFRKMH